MGRRQCTSFIHDTHEYRPKHASRPGLFICTSYLGGSVKSICASRPHCTKTFPNTPSYQMFHGGEYGILTCSYCRTTKTKRGLWGIRSGYHGCTICRSNHFVYANAFMGSHHRQPGKVGKLNKALYGLPEAARVWCEDLEDKLKSLGFAPLGSDTGVFLNKSPTGFTAIDTHVDNETRIFLSKEESRLKAGIQNSTR